VEPKDFQNPKGDVVDKRWIFIILLGLVIRVLDGVRIPLFIDEVPILYNVAHFVKEQTLIPTHFNYPTFFSYLIAIPVMTVFALFYVVSGYPLSGLTDTPWMGFLFSSKLSLLAYGGRIVSLVFSLGTIYLITRYGRRRFGPAAGLWAGMILCIDPFGGRFVAYSRYCLPDVAAVFLVALGMVFCFQYLENGRGRALYLAAVAVGLAISTKYNAGMAVIPLLLTPLIRREKKFWKTMILAGLLVAGGFLLGSPGWALVPKKFIQGYLFEARHMAAGHLGAHDIDWVWVFVRLWGLKTYILPFAILAVGYSILKREKEDILILALIIPSFLVIGQFEKKSIHYFLYLYPMVALLMGRWISEMGRLIPMRTWKQVFALACGLLFILYPSYRIGLMIRRDLMVDNRIAAQEWVERNVPRGLTIVIDPLTLRNLMDVDTNAKTVEALKQTGTALWQEARRFYESKPAYSISSIRDIWEDKASLDTLQADYVMVSYENYGRFFTDNPHQVPDALSPLYREYHRKKAFYFYLFDEQHHPFRHIKVFDTIAGPEVKIFKRVVSQDSGER